MIKIEGFNTRLYGEFPKEVLEMDSIIKKLVMTCTSTPEQYVAYDMYGNKVAYFRVRGTFSVDCPDCNETNVFTFNGKTADEPFYGEFVSSEQRAAFLIVGIRAVDIYYNNTIRLTKRVGDSVALLKGCTQEEVLNKLCAYEDSHFTTQEVDSIRRKGTTKGVDDAIMMMVYKYRIENHLLDSYQIGSPEIESAFKNILDSNRYVSIIKFICTLYHVDNKYVIDKVKEYLSCNFNTLSFQCIE